MDIKARPAEVNLWGLRNEKVELAGEVRDANGDLVDLTGWTIRWILSATEGGAAIITKTVTSTPTAAGYIESDQVTNKGEYVIEIDPADTSGLDVFDEDGTVYHHSAKGKDGDGDYKTLTIGHFRFERERQDNAF